MSLKLFGKDYGGSGGPAFRKRYLCLRCGKEFSANSLTKPGKFCSHLCSTRYNQGSDSRGVIPICTKPSADEKLIYLSDGLYEIVIASSREGRCVADSCRRIERSNDLGSRSARVYFGRCNLKLRDALNALHRRRGRADRIRIVEAGVGKWSIRYDTGEVRTFSAEKGGAVEKNCKVNSEKLMGRCLSCTVK